MGKRSSYERRERDFYPTPAKAVPPLIPHLRGVRRFAEPCCGDGSLVRHLEAHGLICTYAGDIATGQDALKLTVADLNGADKIITNPPYSDKPKPPYTRELMHRLIQHFLCIAPSWLLLELDSAATNQASPYLRHCSDIVPIGRLKLIPGTKGGGMQNFAWYHFDARHTAGPVMHPRGSAPANVRRCAECERPYHATRSDSRFCDDTCRQRAHRRLSRDRAVTAPAPDRAAT
jgi:hypothetical protein